MDWQQYTYSLDHLRMRATDPYYQWTEETGAMGFLRRLGIVPDGVKWARKPRYPRLGIDPNKLTGEYLAESATEWDEEGLADPIFFVEMLEMEVAGPHRTKIARTLDKLGRPEDGDAGLI